MESYENVLIAWKPTESFEGLILELNFFFYNKKKNQIVKKSVKIINFCCFICVLMTETVNNFYEKLYLCLIKWVAILVLLFIYSSRTNFDRNQWLKKVVKINWNKKKIKKQEFEEKKIKNSKKVKVNKKKEIKCHFDHVRLQHQ